MTARHNMMAVHEVACNALWVVLLVVQDIGLVGLQQNLLRGCPLRHLSHLKGSDGEGDEVHIFQTVARSRQHKRKPSSPDPLMTMTSVNLNLLMWMSEIDFQFSMSSPICNQHLATPTTGRIVLQRPTCKKAECIQKIKRM